MKKNLKLRISIYRPGQAFRRISSFVAVQDAERENVLYAITGPVNSFGDQAFLNAIEMAHLVTQAPALLQLAENTRLAYRRILRLLPTNEPQLDVVREWVETHLEQLEKTLAEANTIPELPRILADASMATLVAIGGEEPPEKLVINQPDQRSFHREKVEQAYPASHYKLKGVEEYYHPTLKWTHVGIPRHQPIEEQVAWCVNKGAVKISFRFSCHTDDRRGGNHAGSHCTPDYNTNEIFY